MSEREATASAAPARLEKPDASSAALWGNGTGAQAASGQPARVDKGVTPQPSPAHRVAAAPPPSGGRRVSFAWATVSVVAIAAVVTLSIVFGSVPVDEAWTAGADEPAPATTEDSGTAAVPSVPSVDETTGGGQEAEPSTSGDSDVSDGDLGLSVPISSPACDGTWVVFVGAATDPATYGVVIETLLESNRGSQYVLTQGGCSSMRQELPDGSQIYAVYLGPFPDQVAACTVQAGIGGLAYVKRMDDVTPPEQLWEC